MRFTTVVFPAPLAPTIARISPLFTSRFISRIIHSSPYRKETPLKAIPLFTPSRFTLPSSLLSSLSLSSILNTLSAAASPWEIVRLTPFSPLTGRYSIRTAVKKDMNASGWSVPLWMRYPAYQIVRAKPTAPNDSMRGEEILFTLIALSCRVVKRSFSSRNLSDSYLSIQKALTILIPPIASWRRAVILPMVTCPSVETRFIFLPNLTIG